MKKVTTFLSVILISSTVFAASSECMQMLDVLIIHAKEGARLNADAIQHGFNIYTGKVDQVDDKSKYAADFMRISLDHFSKVESIEEKLKNECLK